MNRRTHVAYAVAGLLIAGLAAIVSAHADEVAAPAAPPVDAVWIQHEVRFTYMGYTSYYSCDGIRDKVRYILKQVGARPDDLKVTVGCLEPFGVERMPSVRIKATMPAEATPETLAKLAEDASHRELVKRVQGSGQGTDDATARFPAVWKTVEFRGRPGARIEDGDCELLDDLTKQVFPKLGVKVTPDSSLSCMPRQVQLGDVRVKLEALAPVPAPDAEVTKT
jgi:hypothetical protein